jgi:hypothetical protein
MFVAIIDSFRGSVWTDGQALPNFDVDLTEFVR